MCVCERAHLCASDRRKEREAHTQTVLVQQKTRNEKGKERIPNHPNDRDENTGSKVETKQRKAEKWRDQKARKQE